MRDIFKVIIFLVIVGFLFYKVSYTFTPKRTKFPYDSDLKVQGFYDEPKNSLDVIFLGSSHMFFGINPNIIYKNNGIFSYNLGLNEQPLWLSYFYLEEALKYQSPKVVVLESFYLQNTDKYSNYRGFAREAVNRINLDPMDFSFNKIQAIYESVPKEEFFKYLFNLNKYHDRWKKLLKSDFGFDSEPYVYKGFTPSFDKYRENWGRGGNKLTGEEGFVFHEKSLEYLDRIVELTKKNNIELVLIKTPYPRGGVQQDFVNAMLAIQKYTDGHDIEFIDYNQIEEEIGFDFNQHISDRHGHLNKYGAEIISSHIGTYLQSKISIEERKDSKIDNLWATNLHNYEDLESKRESQLKIKRAKTLPEYLKYAKVLDLLVLTSVRDDGSGQYRNYHKVLEEFGLQSSLDKKFRWSYLGVKNTKANYVQEFVDSIGVDYSFKLGKLNVKMESVGGNKAGNKSSIIVNGKEYSENLRGHNFVIIDLNDETVYDSFNIDTHGDNTLTIKRKK